MINAKFWIPTIISGHSRNEHENQFFGISGMGFAAIALIVAVTHLTIGPFAPQKSIEKTITKAAVAIKDAAERAIKGEEASPELPSPQSRWNINRMIDITVIGLAAMAMLFAIVALVRREHRKPAFVSFLLGAGVLLMAYLQWIALLICGVILLVAIINNLDSILP